jgi:hypothetical protein
MNREVRVGICPIAHRDEIEAAIRRNEEGEEGVEG